MIVAGVGFRRSVAADEIVALVELALERASLARDALDRLATIAALAETPAFKEAARRLNVTAMPVDRVRPRRGGTARTHAIRALHRGAWSRIGRGGGGACGRRALRQPHPRAHRLPHRNLRPCPPGDRGHEGPFHRSRSRCCRSHHGAGPFARRTLSRLPLCRIHRAAGDAVLVPARRAARRHCAPRPRRHRRRIPAGA